MTQMMELIVASATGMMTVLVGIAVKAMKDYLIQKGGEKAVRIAEILAKNAVHAVEQVHLRQVIEARKSWNKPNSLS